MTFEAYLEQCRNNSEFVARFDRENGANIGCQGNAMELLIYDVSGRLSADAMRFVNRAYADWLKTAGVIVH